MSTAATPTHASRLAVLADQLIKERASLPESWEEGKAAINKIIRAEGFVPDDSIAGTINFLFKSNRYSNDNPQDLIHNLLSGLKPNEAAPQSLVGQLFSYASKLFDMFSEHRVFISANAREVFMYRYVGVQKLMGTPLSQELWKKVRSDLPKTIVIAGTSGSGKTCSVLALSRESLEDGVIVAYFIISFFKWKGCTTEFTEFGARVAAAANAAERNGLVLAEVARCLIALVPDEAFAVMDTMTKPFRFVLFIDEMGGEKAQAGVRALCDIDSREIKAELRKSKPGYSLNHITFVLCVAGTGIGVADDAPTGSHPKAFEVMFPPECHGDNGAEANEEFNRKMFAAAVGIPESKTREVERMRDVIHPFVWRMISENARFAAILGSEAGTALQRLTLQNPTTFLQRIDLTQFLGPAIFKFKSLNALQSLALNKSMEVLLKVLRLQWFPHSLTADSGRMDAKYGLIIDRAQLGLDDPYSPKVFPFFTTGLLALLSGSPVIARSLISGAPLEGYMTIVMHMLACAANDEDLLLMALKHNDGGSLVPMKDARLKETDPAASSSGAGAFLPAQADRDFRCTVHEMNRKGDGIVKFVEKILSDTFGSVRQKDGLFIATFSSYDKAPFADAFTFMGSRFFLFESKDSTNGLPETVVDNELPKLGGAGRSRQTLQLLVAAWFIATGVRITCIHRVFVTSTPTVLSGTQRTMKRPARPLKVQFGNEDSKVIIDEEVHFVSIDKIRFLPFDAVRDRVTPPFFGAPEAEAMRLTKTKDPTPQILKAQEAGMATVAKTPTNASATVASPTVKKKVSKRARALSQHNF